jgi:hypothetical protein
LGPQSDDTHSRKEEEGGADIWVVFRLINYLNQGARLKLEEDEPVVGLIQHSQTNTFSFLISRRLGARETWDQRVSVEERESLAEFALGVPLEFLPPNWKRFE